MAFVVPVLGFHGLDLQVGELLLVQSPLTEKIGCDPFPKSHFSHKSFNGETFMSPYVLPSLKFHSGLLAPRLVIQVDYCFGKKITCNID